MSLLSIAALALQAGPSVIRGISSLFGGNETAENLAKAVEAVDGAVSMSKEQKQIALTRELQAMPPEALVDLERVKVEMEKEITRRQELALQDKQAEHHETQETIRAGDKAADEYVRQTRPKMARQSFLYMVLYVFLFEGLKINGSGEGADIYIALTIGSIAFAYHGLRTLDGFAPYSKSSGDKVAGALKSVIKGR
ncbi:MULTISPECIES: hypothetical protein [Vibrio]|uniref:hypothetical protein n=1 Tax=Vibrio TaxID=662 RepID=UPI00132E9568|nr:MULTISPECIES: hypothetical protein [Vibrio]MBE3696755.1 DUF190 domain-containing protein [Vibrio parahaemolyticus]MBE3775892.1 DUF190 domain-containing protein [Vibrio parahaemolyticus]MBN8107743.1 hypothetical protein [Vibrio vulnificus]QHH01528.1 hypothetical protein EHC64_20800 [Vibrio parahaemolyticus]QHH06641.1 hypothetical protein EHC66_20395 [Vibrio parahaemolyticus]